MTEPQPTLSKDEARILRRELKDALTGFANGRGSLTTLFHEIERVAKAVSGKPDGTLQAAERRVRSFVRSHAPNRVQDTGLPGVNWRSLYRNVREARNDIAHTGTEAVLAGMRASAMGAVLMEALARASKSTSVGRIADFMVSNPTCAHGWQTLADVRRTMLVNDYSVLPLADGYRGTEWRSVRAEDLAACLHDGAGEERAWRLEEAMSDGRLEEYTACTVCEETPLDRIWSEPRLELPLVVTRRVSARNEMVGIVTAFDLL